MVMEVFKEMLFQIYILYTYLIIQLSIFLISEKKNLGTTLVFWRFFTLYKVTT